MTQKNFTKKLSILILGILFVVCLFFIYHKNSSNLPASSSDNDSSIVQQENLDEEETKEDYLFTVCIDAGHGGKDRGSDSKGRIEKHDCIKIAKAVAKKLQEDNDSIRVILTRDDDSTLSLEERCQIANEEQADYMVSIHRNKGKGTGVETWISKNASAESTALASSIMNGLNQVGISRNRGVKIGSQSSKNEDYYINHHSQMPSCLIELGFINSADDNALFDQNIATYASAISDAICQTYDLFHTQNPQEAFMKEQDFAQMDDADRKSVV